MHYQYSSGNIKNYTYIYNIHIHVYKYILKWMKTCICVVTIIIYERKHVRQWKLYSMSIFMIVLTILSPGRWDPPIECQCSGTFLPIQKQPQCILRDVLSRHISGIWFNLEIQSTYNRKSFIMFCDTKPVKVVDWLILNFHLRITTPKVNKTVQLMSPVVTEKIKYRIDFLMFPIKWWA